MVGVSEGNLQPRLRKWGQIQSMTNSILLRGAWMKLTLAAGTALALTQPVAAQTSLTGAGATFPSPIYQKWFNAYQSVGKVQISYTANGSGGGIKAVTDGTTDFGASDMPMTDEQMSTFKEKQKSNILMFPTVLGAVVPSYNVPGITKALNFTPDVLAGIFMGKITKWNSPEIAKANPGVSLPDLKIVVVHRSDGSGTTFCFTDYLSKVDSEWKSKIGKNTSVEWPTGLGAKGNDGVSGLLTQQKGSLGYLELIYAIKNKLPYGNVKNKSGEFVKADLASVTAAAAALKTMPADFRVSITNGEGKGVYPISTFTWLLVPSKFSDSSKEKALVGFLKWAISTGQSMVESEDYAKLPASVVAQEQKQIGLIQ